MAQFATDIHGFPSDEFICNVAVTFYFYFFNIIPPITGVIAIKSGGDTHGSLRMNCNNFGLSPTVVPLSGFYFLSNMSICRSNLCLVLISKCKLLK